MDWRWLAVCASLAMAVPASAADPSYLSEWPTVEQVLADHQGANPQDTMARQMAALNILRTSIEEMAGPRRWHGLTPDEESLRGQYYTGAEKIRDVVNATLSNELGPGFHGPFAKPPLREWYALQWDYESDPAFRATTLQRYLSPTLLATLGAQAHATPDTESTRAGQSRGRWPTYLAGLAAVLALVMVVRAYRRRLSRRRTGEVDAETGPTDVSSDGGDSGGLKLSERDRKAAAEEVLDTLEPYLIAAQQSGRPLPLQVLADPVILGFLTTYCGAALAVVTGFDARKFDSSEEALVLKHMLLLQVRSRPALFTGKIEEPSGDFGEQAKDEASARLGMGVVFATAAMQAFKNDKVDDSPAERERGGPDPGELLLAEIPPPTRLHPDGPNAGDARRLLLAVFSKRLASLAKDVQ